MSQGFPDHKDAVQGPVEKAWDPRDSLRRNSEEILRYYRGVAAKVNMHAMGHLSRGGLLDLISEMLGLAPTVKDGFKEGRMTDSKGR